jgi:hypothetical protein
VHKDVYGISRVWFLGVVYDNFVDKHRGGKLISTSGWDNGIISPLASIKTFDKLAQNQGSMQALNQNARLYMVPGMGNDEGIHSAIVPHGQGTVVYDSLSALVNWVEKGIAPDTIAAASIDNKIKRPLCVYPKVARRINPSLPDPNLANYVCVNPK